MYSRAVIAALTVIALSAPTVLAAPARSQASQHKREALEVYSRDLAELQARQQSGALSWQDVENFGNKVLDGIQQVTPVITDAADIYNKVSGKEKREAFDELLARQQSGALSWQDVENFGDKVLNGIQQVTPVITGAADLYNKVTGEKRDVVRDLLARQQSGALSWQDVYDWGNDVLNGIQEVTPVITQAADIYNKVNDKGKRQTTTPQESGALSWQDVENFGDKVLNGIQEVTPVITGAADLYNKVTGKRDVLSRELHVIARDIIGARAVDASGAISWDDVKDFGKGFVQGFTKTAETVLPVVSAFVKREEMDLFARQLTDALVARQAQDMQSGAVSWDDVKDFGKGFVQGFTKTAETVLPVVSAFVKREDMELLARQLPGVHDFLAREEKRESALDDVKDFGKGFVQGFTKTAETVLPIVSSFVKREDMDVLTRDLAHLNALLAREESGAISWDDVKDFGKGFVQGFTKTVSAGLPLVGALVRRESALDDVKDFGKGFVQGFTKTAETVLPIVSSFVKRESALDDVKDFGKGFVQGFTKTAETVLPIVSSFVKREEFDILTRDLAHLNDLLARQESGAISWDDVKDFGKGFVQGFTKTVSAGLPIVASLVKKEDMETLLLARDMGPLAARSLNELD
ncbi:hypothetical protein EIP91_008838 [Steccherinum ochraceum]|uniref:Uncharacterized protein n=1 Tax=Steccherinum ochraceum TaxID=92696 RepID=A0A4R0RC49_9APHY|nr:hypothetical protein EIP91_008838 [Steccherinum ochraceum]